MPWGPTGIDAAHEPARPPERRIPQRAARRLPDEPPRWARRLGYAGLVPFLLGAALVWFVHPEAHPYTTLALSAYAAAIVSFLGGLHWGLAMRASAVVAADAVENARVNVSLAWAVVPPLVAWPAVMMPPSAGLIVLGVMFIVCYLVDRRVFVAQGLAAWLTLRFRLSAVAALSCFLGAAGT